MPAIELAKSAISRERASHMVRVSSNHVAGLTLLRVRRIEGNGRPPACFIGSVAVGRLVDRYSAARCFEGNWRGRQIVPAQWVKDSTRAYSQTDFGPGSGYGYLWWTGFGRLPPGTFFAAGAGGQFAFVIPTADLVLILANSSPRVGEIGRLLSLVLDAAGTRHP